MQTGTFSPTSWVFKILCLVLICVSTIDGCKHCPKGRGIPGDVDGDECSYCAPCPVNTYQDGTSDCCYGCDECGVKNRVPKWPGCNDVGQYEDPGCGNCIEGHYPPDNGVDSVHHRRCEKCTPATDHELCKQLFMTTTHKPTTTTTTTIAPLLNVTASHKMAVKDLEINKKAQVDKETSSKESPSTAIKIVFGLEGAVIIALLLMVAIGGHVFYKQRAKLRKREPPVTEDKEHSAMFRGDSMSSDNTNSTATGQHGESQPMLKVENETKPNIKALNEQLNKSIEPHYVPQAVEHSFEETTLTKSFDTGDQTEVHVVHDNSSNDPESSSKFAPTSLSNVDYSMMSSGKHSEVASTNESKMEKKQPKRKDPHPKRRRSSSSGRTKSATPAELRCILSGSSPDSSSCEDNDVFLNKKISQSVSNLTSAQTYVKEQHNFRVNDLSIEIMEQLSRHLDIEDVPSGAVKNWYHFGEALLQMQQVELKALANPQQGQKAKTMAILQIAITQRVSVSALLDALNKIQRKDALDDLCTYINCS